ncbi:exopolysaccharide biosynthesis protein [Pseudaminobacter arsenicus]|uniref:Exopolysaccharide biosynthesis protein n=1 Tax=Borborobacter arsenicus TaxID=1851146 RepID=A0A432VC06_9HYPH|nr:exopolysaccharide biosynthesis protein [Pseudaminobacter arsenicus]RUM99664.1 exopolysaccharide biosynthesis protein [Pseudaminobacter arsenicus]
MKESDAGGTLQPRRRARQLSQLFMQLAEDAEDRVTMGSIRDALGTRSFAALLVLFAAFNLLPLPPGASAFLGVPLLIVSAQMMYGSKRVWLPQFVTEKSLSAEQFRAIMARVIPRLTQVERFIKPRYWPFWRRRGDRVIGIVAFLLAIVVTLPIPLGNWLPAFSTALLGLALSERDGILLAVGGAVGVAALSVVMLVVGTATAATQAALGWVF